MSTGGSPVFTFSLPEVRDALFPAVS